MNAIARIYEANEASNRLDMILQIAEQNGGDITGMEQQFDELTIAAANLPDAINDAMIYVTELEKRAIGRKEEAKRLADRARQDAAAADWVKSQILRTMQSRGIKKLETTHFKLTVAMPGGKPSMEILDDVPEAFQIEVVTHEPDKEAIREKLEQGDTLPFARLVPKQPYLRIS